MQSTEKHQPIPQVFVMLADPILEELYRSKLSGPDYCMVWCENDGGWAKSIVSIKYDVIIVDFALFPVEPVEHLKEIKRISPDSEMIVLSPSEDVRVCIDAFQAGIADYFLKPTNPETLAWSIEKVLKQRALQSSNETLAADLQLFRAAHHINMSENDAKMRSVAAQTLIKFLQARGAVWVWPEGTNFTYDYIDIDEKEGQDNFEFFKKEFSGIWERAFEGVLTSHPEQWFQDSFVWIPLRATWMGGIFLFPVQAGHSAYLQARVEFLIRNLEVSLENQKRYLEARQLTYIDDFTGLYNARYLDVALTASIERHHRTGSGFALLFIDIDRFKSVNDRHGHLVGSQLLVDIARTLKKYTRRTDQLFRYGGDEFIIILNDKGGTDALEVAERLRSSLEAHVFRIQGIEIRITASIGVSKFPEHSRDKSTILQMADRAMYSGKSAGRNAVFEANF